MNKVKFKIKFQTYWFGLVMAAKLTHLAAAGPLLFRLLVDLIAKILAELAAGPHLLGVIVLGRGDYTWLVKT